MTDGTDAQEKAFFGYNGEAQSSVTGLVYMRFRHYDPTSAHFGVQDTYLGNTFNPASLNRYLFCESDPINNIDPTGHISSSFLSFAAKSSKRGAATAQAYSMKKQAQVNSIAARAVAAITNTIPSSGGRISTPSSNQYKINSVYRGGSSRRYASPRINPKNYADRAFEQFRAYYCGDFASLMQSSLNSMSPSERMHGTFDMLGMLIPFPAASSIPDLLNGLMYGVEGDGENASLSLGFAGIAFIGGSIGKGTAKGIHIGAGVAKGSVGALGEESVRILGKGSTGRTEAKNIFETAAMRETKKNPLDGAFDVPIEMSDSRWLKEDGWVKKQRVFETSNSSITIHFNYNTKTGEFDDFKFTNEPDQQFVFQTIGG